MPNASLCAREIIVEILNSSYGGAKLLQYSESDDEIGFQVLRPIRDTQTEVFRSGAMPLNDLAISHRLSLCVGRLKYGIPEGFAFAIKAVETVVQSVDTVGNYDVSLRFNVGTKRHNTVIAFRSTLITEYGVEARTTITSFNIIPPSLANFVRRARQFVDYADVKISRDESYLSTIDENHFRYYPSENDRLSDGRRVDHVPALVLIDIALFVNRMAHEEATYSNIAAEFMTYTDPRRALEIIRKDRSAIEFLQDGHLVAIVYNRECPGSTWESKR